jgi:hypothetical protein
VPLSSVAKRLPDDAQIRLRFQAARFLELVGHRASDHRDLPLEVDLHWSFLSASGLIDGRDSLN